MTNITENTLGCLYSTLKSSTFYLIPLSKPSTLRSNISALWRAQPGWRHFQNSIFSLRRPTGRLDWVDIFCWLLRYASRRRRRKGTEGERRTFLVGQRHSLSLLTIHPSCLYSVTRSRSSEKGGTISADGAIVSHLLWSLLYWTRSLSMDAKHYFGVRAVHIVHCEVICSNDRMESHILFVHKDLTKNLFS